MLGLPYAHRLEVKKFNLNIISHAWVTGVIISCNIKQADRQITKASSFQKQAVDSLSMVITLLITLLPWVDRHAPAQSVHKAHTLPPHR